MSTSFNYIFAFIIGSCIGSFINVVVYRLPNDLSIIKPRSFCPKCKTQLTWRENIPFISWLIQGRKCNTCKTNISFKYPLIEISTGASAQQSITKSNLGNVLNFLPFEISNL